MSKRRTKTEVLILTAYQRAGYRKSVKVLQFVAMWGITTRRLGHVPTVDEFAEDWGMSRAQGFRDQAAFRELFPEYDTPTVIVEHLRSEHPRLFAEDDPGLVALRMGGFV